MSYPKVPEKRQESDLLLSKEIDVEAPIETVFAVLTDFALFVDLEEPVQEVVIVSDIKEGKGVRSQWRLVDPDTGDRWSLEEEIIHYDRPFQYAYVGISPTGKDYTGVHNLSRNPAGSTHILFNEVFHFDADPDIYGGILDNLLKNVKKEAERRAAL